MFQYSFGRQWDNVLRLTAWATPRAVRNAQLQCKVQIETASSFPNRLKAASPFPCCSPFTGFSSTAPKFEGRRMKSFRLDLDSVQEVVEGWPVFLVSIVLGTATAWFATNYLGARILTPLLFGIALGPRLIGALRQKYPTAKQLWLLSIGMATVLVGVTARMAFPSWQGAGFDLSWLGVAFFSILAFVLVNRGNKDVV